MSVNFCESKYSYFITIPVLHTIWKHLLPYITYAGQNEIYNDHVWYQSFQNLFIIVIRWMVFLRNIIRINIYLRKRKTFLTGHHLKHNLCTCMALDVLHCYMVSGSFSLNIELYLRLNFQLSMFVSYYVNKNVVTILYLIWKLWG